MHVKPIIRRNMCLTAHPAGCARYVREQINYILHRKGELRLSSKHDFPKNVLIVGGSTGYGLAARVVASFGYDSSTIGIFHEKPGSARKSGTAGWYNSLAFGREARLHDRLTENVNGDAFTDETKERVIRLVKEKFGKLDLVIYSLAAPRRRDPRTGKLHSSHLRPIGEVYRIKTVDFMTGLISETTTGPSSQLEVDDTVHVMGGADWELWIEALDGAGVLSDSVITVAFSYIGPALTYPIYRRGTLGKAKEHLEATALSLDQRLRARGARAFVSVNKALVTRASAVIPAVPLYISILYKVMKEKGIHEGPIEQIYRLFAERLYSGRPIKTDPEGRIRLDDLELRDDVQREVAALWGMVTTGNLEELTDISGFRKEFLRLNGFGFEGIDYSADVEV